MTDKLYSNSRWFCNKFVGSCPDIAKGSRVIRQERW